MYQFQIFQQANIKPYLELVYKGIKLEMLVPKAMQDFVYWKLENDLPVTDIEFEILDTPKTRIDLLELLDNSVVKTTKEEDFYITQLLRLAILEHIAKNNSNVNALLNKIEETYVLFDYPHDLAKFICYMPESAELTKDIVDNNDKKAFIAKSFLDFLRNEQQKLL